MRAVVQDRYGPAERVLRVEDVPTPRPGEGEVLVRVHAAAMHPDIWHVVTGLPYAIRLMGAGVRRPRVRIPGTDLAGVVEAVGPGVERFAEGDEVFGEVVMGFQWKHGATFAEHAVAPAAALAHKPSGITMAQAAAAATTGLITLNNLRPVLPLTDRRVLVNGAGGGVGSLAVQIAKADGATVVAVDHARKLELLRELGADEVVDYTTQDALRAAPPYDVVFDVASTLPLAGVKAALRDGGKYIRIGHEHFEERRHRWLGSLPGFFALVARSSFDDALPGLDTDLDYAGTLEALRARLEAGTLAPVVDREHPLEAIHEAFAHMRSDGVRGRSVMTP